METAETLLRTLVLCVVAGIAAPAVATTYYIAPDGDDAAPGTAEQPWATLEHAAAHAGPGDTVLLAPGEYPGQLQPRRSGEADAPIVFRAAERHQAVLTGPEDGPAVALRDVSHICLEGLAFRPRSDEGTWLLAARAQSVQLHDLWMAEARRGDAVRLIDCSDVRFTDCTMLGPQSWNMVHISGSQRLVFEGCEFAGSAHSLLLFLPDQTNQQVVIRGCLFAGRTGRTVLIDSVDRLLFENNVITRSLDGGRSAGPRFGYYASNSIFRGSRIYDNWGPELFRIQPYRETLDFARVRVYNNVFHGNCSDALTVRNFEGKYNVADAVFANNVFAGNEPFGSRRQIIIREEDPRGAIEFRGNLIDGAVEILGKLLQASELADDEFMQATVAGSPRFADADSWEHVPAEGSLLIDGGVFLSRAVADGEGQRLQVEDAQWFYDGYGIEGERGDLIAVGSPENVARVVSADYEADVLELDRPLRWSVGDPVSLPWAGEAPDIGVFEVGARGLAPPVVVATPYPAEPGEPVTLRAIMPAEVPGASVRWQLSDGTLLEGAQVRHTFAQEGEWGLRVRVEPPGGGAVRAAGIALVERRLGDGEPLVRSTFGPDDDEAWWRWQVYRPGTTYWSRVETDEGHAMHVMAPEDRAYLPFRTNPRGWNIDRYPSITVRYRIGEGAPVAAYVEAFSPHVTDESRRIYLAGTEAAMPLPDAPDDAQVLIDDGEWHTLRLDARALRERWPDVTVAMRFALEGQWQSARDRVQEGHEFWIGEVIIGPENH